MGTSKKHHWATDDASVIVLEKKSTSRKFQKTKVRSLSIQQFYFALALTIPKVPRGVRVCLKARHRHQKATHNEIQVTRDQACSMRAIRTVRKLVQDDTAYDSQAHIRRGYRFVGLHLRRLRGHERAISRWLGNLCSPITVPLSVTFRPKLPGHSFR